MATKTQRPQGQNDILSSLNMAIDALDLAKEATTVVSAKAAFTSASVLLTVIRVGLLPVHVGRFLATKYVQDSMVSKADYVELGLACVNVCEALNRRMSIKRTDQVNQSILEAIEKLTL